MWRLPKDTTAFYLKKKEIQLYTSNYLRGITGKEGIPYGKHSAVCLETQFFPDSANQPDFPSTLLRPGEEYSSVTVYRFSTAHD